jgi:UDPglucose--hexose-1-phosphate uridylyltransferase
MELRKDYILDSWVYISAGRKKRKMEFKEESSAQGDAKSCFFCPGNEDQTPEEKGRIEDKGKWIIRWFDNKFAAVEMKGDYKARTADTFFTYSDSWGEHEIVVETDDHRRQLWDFDSKYIKKIFCVYRDRINELEKGEGISYVQVFKNHGLEAGTSLVHSHSQIIAMSRIPELVKRKAAAAKKFGENCPYCRIAEIEKSSDRRCFENDTFVAFCPYASMFNYELLIMPKRHVERLDKLTDAEMDGLADITKKALGRLKRLNPSYNLYIHYSPAGEKLHLQIHLCPRIALWGGFEMSSQTIINIVSPEEAAKFYRGESES